jgi:hypothetical protein
MVVLKFDGTLEQLKELVRSEYPDGEWFSCLFYDRREFVEGHRRGRVLWNPDRREVEVTGKGRAKARFEATIAQLLEEHADRERESKRSATKSTKGKRKGVGKARGAEKKVKSRLAKRDRCHGERGKGHKWGNMAPISNQARPIWDGKQAERCD